MRPIKTTLISVSDKSGIIEFAKALQKQNVKIISTGGTARILKDAMIPVVTVDETTGFPEILDGRVKTLHPKIHAGILAKRTKKHLTELKKLGIDTIDMVVVNLYPFEQKPSIENIDIGGVALLRAAAKNFENVVVVCDPTDYYHIIANMKMGKIDFVFRKQLAAKAFRHIAYYDAVISNFFTDEPFPEKISIGLKKLQELRYGENPHQKAVIYQKSPACHQSGREVRSQKSEIKQLQGKELSYNNYLDLDSAFNLVCEFQKPSCVIVKHNNPCGVATAKTIFNAYKNALACDPVSAFGGIVAFNKTVDVETAKKIIKIFTECVIALNYSKDALKIFSQKQNLRVLSFRVSANTKSSICGFRSVFNDKILVQERDNKIFDKLKIVTKRKPTKQELESLKFAFTVAKHVKSNAIVLVRGTQTVGIGAGQMSRIDALHIATMKLNSIPNPQSPIPNLSLVLASDAFFPFRDVVDAASKIGVGAIIQPGGSLNDKDSIKACNEHKISMVFTGIRHFRH
ncbi:MAG: bifunctional phosphoribosylaminoimidazolecarboxamide formyltransferase/IMP cyclohydrolase [Elusimicrobiota bacterium]